MNRVNQIEAVVVIAAALLAVLLYAQITLWMNQRFQESCNDLIQLRFRELPAHCEGL